MRGSTIVPILSLTLAVVVASWPYSGTAKEAAVNDEAVSIESVAWIAGAWRGEALGGTVEEFWAPPAGRAMLGSFRFLKGEGVGFYEILAIAEENGSLVLRLKHFHGDLRGWEERDEVPTMPLLGLAPGEARFDGFTFRRRGDDGLDVFVRSHGKDGSESTLEFHYSRIPAP